MSKKDDSLKSVKKNNPFKRDKKDYKDMYLRALADYDNLKKDTEKQKQDWIRFANTNLITEVLPVLDNFKVAIKHIPDNEKSSSWVVGVKHIQDQLQKALEGNGVKEIKTIGEKFNPEMHEAVVVDDVDVGKIEAIESGSIFKEIKPGYIYKLKIEDISKRAGNYTGHLTVRTDRPEKPKLVVIIDGEVTENGTEGRNTLHGHNLRFSIVQ